MMTVYGYIRINSNEIETSLLKDTERDLEAEIDLLLGMGVSKSNLVVENADISGTLVEFETLLSKLETGDTLYVARFSDCNRSIHGFLNLQRSLSSKGILLIILNLPKPGDPAFNQYLQDTFAALAEIEKGLRSSQQTKSIKKNGRPPKLDQKDLQKFLDACSKGASPKILAKKFRISESTAYRIRRGSLEESQGHTTP